MSRLTSIPDQITTRIQVEYVIRS